MLNKTPERQDKNKEIRRSKVVLLAVGIAAVIAMTAIQIKKMIDTAEKKLPKSVAAAPEKTGENGNQASQPVPQDSAVSNDTLRESLIENDEFIGDCKPASLQDACDILREADINSVQCDIYTAANQAFAFSNDGKTLEDDDFYNLSDVFEGCDLNEEQQKKILRVGIQQGDTNIGAFVREDWIGHKCDNLYQSSPDYKKNEDRYKRERDACEEIPPESTYEDVKNVDATVCKTDEEKAKKHCEDTAYPFVCKREALDDYNDCFNALVPGLSYEAAKKTPGTQLYCSTTIKREHAERSTEWMKQCYRDLSKDLGVEWGDVESLYKIKTAEDFIRIAQERDGCRNVHDYITSLYWMDVQHPDVLSVLGVRSPDGVAYKYIDDEIEECVLSQYNEALRRDEDYNYYYYDDGGRQTWEYGGTYSEMEDIKKGKYPEAGSECTEYDLYCDENELF